MLKPSDAPAPYVPGTLSESELTRRRAAYNLIFFGMLPSGGPDFERRIKYNKSLSDTEQNELVFGYRVRRIIAQKKTTNAAERAILRAYESIEETDEKGAAIVAAFNKSWNEAVNAPMPSGEKPTPAEVKRRSGAFPVPAEVQAHRNDVNAAQHNFMALLLAYFEKKGTLPESLRQPPTGKPLSAPKEADETLPDPSLSDARLFASSKVHGYAMQFFSRLNECKPDEVNGFALSLYQESTDSKGRTSTALFGVRGGPAAESMGELLARGGPVAVKAWYALWALWYKHDAHPMEAVAVPFNEFCEYLGYEKHVHGGYKIEVKQQAVKVLDAITALEMTVRIPSKDPKKIKEGKMLQLQGRIWERGVLKEEGYQDLFNPSQLVNPDPIAFRYRPGDWFSDPEFRAKHYVVGMVGEGLLKLENNRDQWAILMGGYLGWQARINQYAETVLFAETILRSANLSQSDDAKRRGGETRDKFERALDRLREVGVIDGWTWAGIDTREPDFDDPDDIANYAADTSAIWKGNEWRREKVVITWPAEFAKRAPLLAAMQQAHIDRYNANKARLVARNAAKQMKAA